MPTPNLNAPYLVEGQEQPEVTHNEALNYLDALVQLAFIDRNINTPPGSPSNGDVYLIGGAPTGAWSGHANQVGFFYDGWLFATPKEGWTARVKDENINIQFDGAAWVDVTTPIAASTVASETLHGLAAAVGASALYARADHTHGSPVQVEKRFYHWQSNIGAATFQTVLGGAITSAGSLTASDDSDAPFINFTTGAVSGNVASFESATLFQGNWRPDVSFLFKTPPTITSVRIFVGLVDAGFTGTDDPGQHIVGIRYSTATDGTVFWRLVSEDGSTLNTFTTAVAVTASQVMTVRFKFLAASIECWINGVLIHTFTTNLPGFGASLACYGFVETLTAATRSFKASRFGGSEN